MPFAEPFGRVFRSSSFMPSFGLALSVLVFSTTAAYAQTSANVFDCTALGTFDQGFVGYGTCPTNENGGVQGVTFGNYPDGTPGDGQLMTIAARTKSGNEAAAAVWYSAQPV